VSRAADLGPVWIRIRTAAVMLDAHRATVWRMVRAGSLEAREILPGSFRVRRAELEALTQTAVVGGGEGMRGEVRSAECEGRRGLGDRLAERIGSPVLIS